MGITSKADAEKQPPYTPLATLQQDPFLVTFSHPHDPTNSRDWAAFRKWAVTSVLSITGFNRIMVSTIMAPALPSISSDLHMTPVESLMALSVYLLATAFGPLLIGPLSELYGHSPVLHASNAWFFIWNLICGFAHTKSVLMASRRLAGLGASAIYSLPNGVLGDVWPPSQRGRSLGLYNFVPLLGAVVGPIIGGFIAGGTTWRWIFWATSIVQACAIVFSALMFRETHVATILERKAAGLRASTGDERYHTRASVLTQGQSFGAVLLTHLTRPFRLLALGNPIIQIQTLLGGYNYGLLYLNLATYSSLWTGHYHQSASSSCLHYLSLCICEIVGSQVGGYLMDRVHRSLRAGPSSTNSPRAELHIPLMAPTYLLTAFGLLLYGWTAQHSLPWPVVDTGVLLLDVGMTVAGQVLNAYVIDAYPEHVASALAATQLVRSLTAFGFSLFAPAMFEHLGYGWANTAFAGLAGLLGLPATAVLWRWGARLRKQARESY